MYRTPIKHTEQKSHRIEKT